MDDAEPISLHPVDEAEARRIVERAPAPSDSWAADYPFDGDLAALGGQLRATEAAGDQRPFGYYRISRRADGVAVGGIGFKGRPDGGVAEIGYGLVPSARGFGYATAAVRAVLQIGAGLGLTSIRADTDHDNVASQRVLARSGFTKTGADGELYFWTVSLDPA